MRRKPDIESYIVRIYRRGSDGDFVGLVQDPDQAQPQSFHSREELLAILDGRSPSAAPAKAVDKQRS